ncbi:hypothetical protein EVA_16494 [gut metagenome]|uniref:Uncharacterized protein n=1 Tax=gut metagenome TaxID=749906 RepID=J9FLT3_9ZZZZ
MKLPSFWLMEIIFMPGLRAKILSRLWQTCTNSCSLVRHHWL